MVSKGSATKGSAQAIDYIMNDKEKGQAVELDRNLISGNNGNEIISEFREIQQFNHNCTNNTYSIVLSPSEEQKHWSNEELKEFGQSHLKNLGLENNQYLMTAHRSTEHSHIHIICNRIDLEGNAHSDQFISKKCQESAEKIAKENGLSTAKEIAQVKSQELKPLKKEIHQAHEFAKDKSNNFNEYKDYMYSKGIEVQPTVNKNGEMQGYRLKHRESELNFKASEIHKNVGLKDLIENRITIDSKLSKPLENIRQNLPTEKILEEVQELKITKSRSRGLSL